MRFSILALFPMLLLLTGCPVFLTEDEPIDSRPPDSRPYEPGEDGGVDARADGGPGVTRCVVHADCAPGDICAAGECQPGNTCADGRCEDGFKCDGRNTCVPAPGYCADDNACESGQVCVSDECRVISDTCTLDSHCGPGRRCENNACIAICTSDNECAAGQTCESGSCRQGAPECQASSDCSAGRCVNGACVNECAAETPCVNANEVCEGGVCVPDWRPRPTCSDEMPCADGHVCVEGLCRTPCNSGMAAECLSFDHQLSVCGEDRFCYSNHEAMPECKQASDCDSNICANGYCR